MRFEFFIDGRRVEFHRDAVTGRAEIKTSDETILLQSPLSPGTHFSLSLTKSWTCNVGGLEGVIEKIRPLFLAGFRSSKYKVFVDGQLRAEAEG